MIDQAEIRAKLAALRKALPEKLETIKTTAQLDLEFEEYKNHFKNLSPAADEDRRCAVEYFSHSETIQRYVKEKKWVMNTNRFLECVVHLNSINEKTKDDFKTLSLNYLTLGGMYFENFEFKEAKKCYINALSIEGLCVEDRMSGVLISLFRKIISCGVCDPIEEALYSIVLQAESVKLAAFLQRLIKVKDMLLLDSAHHRRTQLLEHFQWAIKFFLSKDCSFQVNLESSVPNFNSLSKAIGENQHNIQEKLQELFDEVEAARQEAKQKETLCEMVAGHNSFSMAVASTLLAHREIITQQAATIKRLEAELLTLQLQSTHVMGSSSSSSEGKQQSQINVPSLTFGEISGTATTSEKEGVRSRPPHYTEL